jgi:hypothetical protein
MKKNTRTVLARIGMVGLLAAAACLVGCGGSDGTDADERTGAVTTANKETHEATVESSVAAKEGPQTRVLLGESKGPRTEAPRRVAGDTSRGDRPDLQ